MKKSDIHSIGTELIREYRAEAERKYGLYAESVVIGFTDGINRLYRAIEKDPRGVEP